MDRQQASFVHRGNTFFGDVDVVGSGSESVVCVRYNGDAREGRLDGLPVAVVAHLLLRELVLLDIEAVSSRPPAFSARPGAAPLDRR